MAVVAATQRQGSGVDTFCGNEGMTAPGCVSRKEFGSGETASRWCQLAEQSSHRREGQKLTMGAVGVVEGARARELEDDNDHG